MNLTDRQKREIDYHQKFADSHKHILKQPFSYEVATSERRRWQNAYWQMYTFLRKQNLKNRNVLIVGCGFGEDALRLAKMGANVYAFDLSQDLLDIARELSLREKLNIDFRRLTAENLDYDSDFFDCVIVRDILHHVEVKRAMSEICRVSKNSAIFVLDEVYTHSLLDKIRNLSFVKKRIYPKLQNFIYQGNVYITEDERKLCQSDLFFIKKFLSDIRIKFFYLFVGRVIPSKYDLLDKLDRLIFMAMGPIGYLFAGRILIFAKINK